MEYIHDVHDVHDAPYIHDVSDQPNTAMLAFPSNTPTYDKSDQCNQTTHGDWIVRIAGQDVTICNHTTHTYGVFDGHGTDGAYFAVLAANTVIDAVNCMVSPVDPMASPVDPMTNAKHTRSIRDALIDMHEKQRIAFHTSRSKPMHGGCLLYTSPSPRD